METLRDIVRSRKNVCGPNIQAERKEHLRYWVGDDRRYDAKYFNISFRETTGKKTIRYASILLVKHAASTLQSEQAKRGLL